MGRGPRVGSITVLGMFIVVAMGATPASAPTTAYFGTSYTGGPPTPTLPASGSVRTAFLAGGGGVGLFTLYDFDGITPGLISGTSFGSCPSAMTLNTVGGSSPLFVVTGASTFTGLTPPWDPPLATNLPSPATNVLTPTSGANVVSPGGSMLLRGGSGVEEDDLRITFSCGGGSGPGAYAVGIDILFQSLDAQSHVAITVYQGSSSIVLYSNTFIPSGIPSGGCPSAPFPGVTDSDCGGAANGHVFFGICSTTPNIGRIVIDDFDADSLFPDANIGYDTIYVRGPGGPGPSC